MWIPIRVEKLLELIIHRLDLIQEALRDQQASAKHTSAADQNDQEDEWRGRVVRSFTEREIQKRTERKEYAQGQKNLYQQVFLNALTLLAVLGAFTYAAIAAYQAYEMKEATLANQRAAETAARTLKETQWQFYFTSKSNQEQFEATTKSTQAQFERNLKELQVQSGAQSEAARGTQSTANTARDALVIGNRPWIKIAPVIASPLTFDQMRNGGPMAMMTLTNRIENVGQSVALNVTTWEEIVPIELETGIGQALTRRQERCEAYRHSRQAEAGSVRFPHDPYNEREEVGTSMADINKLVGEHDKTLNADRLAQVGGKVGFVLVGCVNYRSSFESIDAPRHQTTFFYWLGTVTPEGAMNIQVFPTGTASQLNLIETSLYFSAD